MAEYDIRALAFPKLDAETLAGFDSCKLPVRKRYRDGEALFHAGDRDSRFFVIISGKVEIVDETGDEPKTVVMHEPGEFAGDVSQITGRPAVVSGYARGEIEVFEVSQPALREILNQHPDLADIILQAFITRRQLLRESGNFVGLRVIGPHSSTETFRVSDFLSRNGALFTWLDPTTDAHVADLLEQVGHKETDWPVVMCARNVIFRNPTNRQLADALGMRRPLQQKVFDLVVVGAGPAGLAAAVYGASEGLSTVVLEKTAPGGQAGRSMRIENYLGFPMGITGRELAERAVLQASKFGASLPIASDVMRMTFESSGPVFHLDGDEKVSAKCVIIATGADYRLLGVEGCQRFEGRGVFYAATPVEAQMCRDADVVVVGAGNSAGQAAVYLAGQARKVILAVRGDNLYKNMSSYLASRVEQTSNIEVLFNTEVRELQGDESLGVIELIDKKTDNVRTVRGPALFSFIGAMPRTDWLPPEIECDAKQFVKTGAIVAQSPHWPGKRQPFFLETTRPGIFAAGDVRAGSVKRVASAVGEGSMAVQFVHEHLKNGR